MKRKIKKILLINPPRVIFRGQERKRVDFPMGLGYIGAMLKLEGYEVIGLDVLLEGYYEEESLSNNRLRFGLSDDKIKQQMSEIKPDVVGVSNMFSSGEREALRMCEIAKEVDPDIITIMGGCHPTSAPKRCVRHHFVDFVVIGEGEYVTGMLLRAIENGKDLRRFPGIAFRQEDGEFVINQYIEPIKTLDLLPWPDRVLFPTYKYAEVGKPHGDELDKFPYTSMITSRGCAARCIYCAVHNVHGRMFRPRSPRDVLDEMEYLHYDLGINEFHIEDDNLTHDRKRAMEIFRGIQERKLDIAWTPASGIVLYTLDEDMVREMKASGCYVVWIAVESGDLDMLRKIKKPLPYKKVAGYVKLFKKYGIKTKGFFMYGFPGETEEQMERTFEFAKFLNLDYASFFLATPLPKTEMWDMAAELNPAFDDPDFDMEKLKYSKSNIGIGGMDFDQMEKIRKKAWLNVNWDLDENDSPPPGM